MNIVEVYSNEQDKAISISGNVSEINLIIRMISEMKDFKIVSYAGIVGKDMDYEVGKIEYILRKYGYEDLISSAKDFVFGRTDFKLSNVCINELISRGIDIRFSVKISFD